MDRQNMHHLQPRRADSELTCFLCTAASSGVPMVVLTNGKCPEHLDEYRRQRDPYMAWLGDEDVDPAGGTPYTMPRAVQHVDSMRPAPLSGPE
ncbi:hypothetical protein ACFYZJ_20695 [Streptomyces sp. NPDC001848]|uniref:hypothetical protein n=1 Tax=Streptomyces sp. NPDC001848 TaxID=3364618 RepID=UPI0036B9FCC2